MKPKLITPIRITPKITDWMRNSIALKVKTAIWKIRIIKVLRKRVTLGWGIIEVYPAN
jgi:hypothetical protein